MEVPCSAVSGMRFVNWDVAWDRVHHLGWRLFISDLLFMNSVSIFQLLVIDETVTDLNIAMFSCVVASQGTELV